MNDKRTARVTQPKRRNRKSESEPPVDEPIRTDEVYTREQFMRRAGIGIKAFNEMRGKGLRIVPLGKRLYIAGADFMRFMEEQPVPTPADIQAGEEANRTERRAARATADIRRIGERLLAAEERAVRLPLGRMAEASGAGGIGRLLADQRAR